MHKKFLIPLLVSVNLTACATATRGSTTLFTVKTTPIGAHVSTTMPVKNSKKITRKFAEDIKSGKEILPDYTFRECEPTPCGIEMPRKADFKVLITKPGYAAQVHIITHKTRKEIKRLNDKKVALSSGAAIAGGAAVGGAFASSLGTYAATSVAGGAAAGAAIVLAPVLLIGLTAKGIDASSGANYDLWPNPAELELLPLNDAQDKILENEQVIETFKQEQPHVSVDILLNKFEEKKAVAERRKRQPNETTKQYRKRRNLERKEFAKKQQGKFGD